MEELIMEVESVSFGGRELEVDVIDSVQSFVVVIVVIDAGWLTLVAGGKLVVVDDGGFVIVLNIEVPVSLVVLPRFLFANSYISPNMPANVFLRFFIVSSASSATEDCVCVGRGWAGRVDDAPEMEDDCDTCESRRPTLDSVGALSPDNSGGSDETLLRLPWRPIDPGPGVVRSGIGGGPLVDTGRGADGTGGAISSVGLPPREEIEDRDTAFAIVGRQTFYYYV